MKSGVRN